MAMVKNALLVVAGLVSGLLLVESVLRLAGWSFPVFGRPDTELGWSFRPGVSGWVTQENPAYVRMNRFGFRGPEWLEQPTPDVFRIVVIGDSFVESSNLSDKHAFTSMIEKHLVACPAFSSGRIEVLNLGVSGYGTAQEYLLLERVWGDAAFRDPRTIDVHIRHLREKLERDAKEPEYIFTVRGVGYRFRDDGR